MRSNRPFAQFLSGFEAGHRKRRGTHALRSVLQGLRSELIDQSMSTSSEDRMAEQENSLLCAPAVSTELPDLSWTVTRLRDFLRSHGGRLSGKKVELLER